MPRKICPVCQNGYIHYVKRLTAFKRVIEKQYLCDSCGEIALDMDRNTWSKGWSAVTKK